MLNLERGRGRSIYSLGGRRGTWASALHCSHTGRAGCPGVGPDVRGFRRLRMSGPRRRMSGLEGKTSGCSVAWRRISELGPDFRAGRRMSGPCRLGRLGCCCCGCSRGRMSGAMAGCPGPGSCPRLLPLVLFIRGFGGLSIFMCILGRILLVPNHAQHSGLR